MANFGIGTLAWSHEVGTAFALRDRAASAQCADRGRRHIAALPAEADAQIVRKVGGLLIAQLVGKSRHCLHALQVGEILCRNAVQHGDDQVARIGETQHRVAPHRHNRVGDAVTVEPVTAGAERQIGDPTGTCCGRRGALDNDAGGSGVSPMRYVTALTWSFGVRCRKRLLNKIRAPRPRRECRAQSPCKSACR